MDKIIVDSSIVIKWFIVQDYSLEANKIFDAYKSKKLILIVPDLIYAEVGSIIQDNFMISG